MATERYDKRIDEQQDKDYFRMYAKLILPLVRGKVLDIGCGQGWLTKEMAEIPEVDMIDGVDKFSEQPVENQDAKITYVKAILPDINTDAEQFDTIVSTEFIEHITQPDLEMLLPKIHKWLKPDGLFLGSTPNKVQPTTNPFHLREYTAEELKPLFEKYNFRGEFDFPRRDLIVWVLNKA